MENKHKGRGVRCPYLIQLRAVNMRRSLRLWWAIQPLKGGSWWLSTASTLSPWKPAETRAGLGFLGRDFRTQRGPGEWTTPGPL